MEIADPERALTLAYAPAAARPALSVLWQLDERFAGVVRSTREPQLGQIRLAWWREALERLDSAPAPEEPLLQVVAAELVSRGVAGVTLGNVADGWTAPLGALPLDEAALAIHAAERGGVLFRAAGTILGGGAAQLTAAGEGWALVDLACNVSDATTAERALRLARTRLEPIAGWRWPTGLRAIGALARLATLDAAAGCGDRRPGSPARVARLLLHRMTGR